MPSVEIPVLAKYRFLGARRNWRPFLSAGPVIRRTSVETRMNSSVLGANPAVGAPPLFNVNRESVSWNADPAISAGMDFRAGRFHLEPEVRYSYWGAGKHDPIRKNQVNFLLGIRF